MTRDSKKSMRDSMHKRAPTMHTVRRVTRWSMWSALAALTALAAFCIYELNRPRDFVGRTIIIQRGDTLNALTTQLREQGVLTRDAHGWQLRLLALWGNRARKIRFGEYRFDARISLRRFLRDVVQGEGQVDIKVAIIEGWTFAQMRAQLRNAPKLIQQVAELSDEQLMAKLGHPNLHPEGRFFPDTYHYTAGQTDLSVYRQAFALMREKLSRAWAERADELPWQNEYDALIIASIIEKESRLESEKPRIAGVFRNRLQKGMRLQTDPTVIYGLGADYAGDITRAHLRTDTPYNTYTRGGLPPTPISLPGWGSILAAMNPIDTDELYFVARDDGSHVFSKTLQQHNRAVREYLLARRKKG